MVGKTIKILVISAKFPPDHAGGYGLRLKEICDSLAGRGYQIRVLSTWAKRKPSLALRSGLYPVIRKLHNRLDARFFPKELYYDLLDTWVVEQHINTFMPDLVYLGHIYPLSKAILPFLARQTVPVILDEGGASLKGAWTEHGRWFHFTGDYGGGNPLIRQVKPLVIKVVCGLGRGRILPAWRWPEKMHVIINSQHNLDLLRTLGIPLVHATVLHSGIDLAKFPYKPRQSLELPITILCPGRVEMRKGMLDGVQLLDQLIKAGIDARLTFAGAVGSKDFMGELLGEIQSAGLQEVVMIHDMLTQSELVDLYHQSDICFFPSYQKMGFSRTPLEAIACGCVVFSYGNEGTNELIDHGEKGYLVAPGDYSKIIIIIRRLINQPEILTQLTTSARKKIKLDYSLKSYVACIEAVIQHALN